MSSLESLIYEAQIEGIYQEIFNSFVLKEQVPQSSDIDMIRKLGFEQRLYRDILKYRELKTLGYKNYKYKSIYKQKAEQLNDLLYIACKHIIIRQTYMCPIDTGNLRDQVVLSPSSSIGWVITYTAPYADYVHEIEYYKHEQPTKAKFLEEAAIQTNEHLKRQIGIQFYSWLQYQPLRLYVGVKPSNIGNIAPITIGDTDQYLDNNLDDTIESLYQFGVDSLLNMYANRLGTSDDIGILSKETPDTFKSRLTSIFNKQDKNFII